VTDQDHLRVTEIFHSIQGESTWAGLPCTFVRLTGCPLRCRWCDTEYSFHGGEKLSLSEILQEVEDLRCELVEITGGEPLIQKNAFRLVKELLDLGYRVLVETSGAVDVGPLDSRAHKIMDLKCPGSGEVDENLWSNLGHLTARDEVKFVLSGRVDFERVYRSMIDDELARPARGAVTGYCRRTGSVMRAYVEVLNLGDTYLEVGNDAAVWLVAYENNSIGHSMTWVRSTAFQFLPFDLAPGESTTMVIDSPPMSGVDWNRMACLVMLEDRPNGLGAYDMLQAAEALPAGLAAAPSTLEMDRRGPKAEVFLAGPHVMSWSATSDVPWIEATPSSGEVPMAVTLTYHPELRAPLETEGTVTFSATGDDMSFETTVVVAVPGSGHRRGARRQAPSRSP